MSLSLHSNHISTHFNSWQYVFSIALQRNTVVKGYIIMETQNEVIVLDSDSDEDNDDRKITAAANPPYSKMKRRRHNDNNEVQYLTCNHDARKRQYKSQSEANKVVQRMRSQGLDKKGTLRSYYNDRTGLYHIGNGKWKDEGDSAKDGSSSAGKYNWKQHLPQNKKQKTINSSSHTNTKPSSTSNRRAPIDTTQFMSKYHHPKNIAASQGKDPYTTITTSYSKTHGLYRQKQVDDEIQRIRTNKSPSSSKITIQFNSTTNVVSVYHHHHHCLDVQFTSSKEFKMGGKGRVIWLWKEWETATDERVMKSVIAVLDSTWVVDSSIGNSDKQKQEDSKQNKISSLFNNKKKCNEMSSTTVTESADDDKRKRAAMAAESRISGMDQQKEEEVEQSHGEKTIKKRPRVLLKHTEKKDELEIIDLVDSD